MKAGLRPCGSYFVSINYATTYLENPDGHNLKSGGVYFVKMMQVDWLHEHDLCILYTAMMHVKYIWHDVEVDYMQ